MELHCIVTDIVYLLICNAQHAIIEHVFRVLELLTMVRHMTCTVSQVLHRTAACDLMSDDGH
jgi:hypothetical protein